MTELKNKDKLTIFLGAVFVFEILILLYFDFFHLDLVDPDLALIFRHLMEISKHHTFFLEDWQNTTNGEFDSPLFFAAPLYTITGKIYLSYAISHVLTIAAYISFVYSLLKKAGVGVRYRLLALITIFAFWSPFAIRYADMMFYNGGWYAYRVFIALLIVSILADLAEGKSGLRYYILLTLYFCLMFLTTVSSGLHMMLCGILPIILCEAVYLYRRRPKISKMLYTIAGAGTLVATGAGYFLNSFMNMDSNAYELHSISLIADNVVLTLADLLDLFLPFSDLSHNDIVLDPISVYGAAQLMCMVMGVIIILFGLMSIRKCAIISTKSTPDAPEGTAVKGHIESLFISTFLWNCIVLILTTESVPRYHLIGFVPLIMCAVINMEKFFSEKDGMLLFFREKSALVIYAAVFIAYGCFSLYYTETDYFHRYDERNIILAKADKHMEENDVGTLFSNDFGMIETMRFYYPDKAFVQYNPQWGGVVMHQDFYRYACDRSSFTDRNMIMMTVEDSNAMAEDFPEYIADNYTVLDEENGYRFFISEHCALDGLSGFPDIDHSMDMASSPGYEYDGKIDGYGALHTNKEGDILVSPDFESDGKNTYDLTVHYALDLEADTVLYMYKDGELLSESPMDNNAQELKVQFPAVKGKYSFRIENKKALPTLIGTMDFDRGPGS